VSKKKTEREREREREIATKKFDKLSARLVLMVAIVKVLFPEFVCKCQVAGGLLKKCINVPIKIALFRHL
jgi:hypothetical protein